MDLQAGLETLSKRKDIDWGTVIDEHAKEFSVQAGAILFLGFVNHLRDGR